MNLDRTYLTAALYQFADLQAPLQAAPRLAHLPHKASWAPKPPFNRMKVNHKPSMIHAL
jgi:predicted sulfurtransferase